MNVLPAIAVAFSALSILVSIFSIAVHLMIPKLLRHPGEFILIQNFAQLVLDVHWLSAIDAFWE